MNIEDLQQKQNSISDLRRLPDARYENIFTIGKNNGYYFYNILKTIKFPENLNPDLFYYKIIDQKLPYTAISYKIYGTQDLWWFIVLSNNIQNPVQYITPGTKLKIIKKEYLKNILTQIKKLNNA